MDSEYQVSLITCIFGGFILFYGLCSLGLKEKLYMSEALVATLYGIFIGPLGVGLIDLEGWDGKHELTREFSRIAIGIQVMVVGITLPKKYLIKEARSLSILLVLVMSSMWIVSALCVWLVFPNLTFLEALMIASCFTPTDPVLANSIVQGHFAEKYVPNNVRNIIVAESGANDGLGYPFLFIAMFLIQMPTGEAWVRWTLEVMLYQIALSIFIGFVTGFLARKLLRLAHDRKLVDEESFSIYALALALFLIGWVGALGSDDLLACFIAGCSFTWDGWYQYNSENSHVVEVIDMMLNLGMFIYIGTIMPWSAMVQLGIMPLVLLAVLVHLFRRLPVVALLYPIMPAVHNLKEALFTGFFGPMGVGSVFYCSVAMINITLEQSDSYGSQILEPIVYAIVLSSILVHGITIPVFQVGNHLKQRISSRYQNEAVPDIERRSLQNSEHYRSYGSLVEQ
ncbi:na h [Lichtheimia corymbifera JMRC:FSU:9682]|uniref:Na h n=1 Tax=Lichtheimia corymbifera JMRC:FSU:9682 TaxID=1263082 RepID=A0A068RWN6_9FUNG|nr:na h [Lichtheimia corymbifera JMRC:FSU:9682]